MIITIKESIHRIAKGKADPPPSDDGEVSNQPVSPISIQPEEKTNNRPPWELYVLVAAIIGQCALVLLGNMPHISIWLLALLAIGVGQALLLPVHVGWFGGLLMIVFWILFRQATGLWIVAERTQNLAEIGGLALNILLAIRYHRLWERQQQMLQEWFSLRQLIYTGEVGSGLLPHSLAELRLLEEIERANTSRRPLGLLLVALEPVKPEPAADFRSSYRAISRQLAGAALVHDVPFRVDSSRLGLILLEREWETLFSDTDAIIDSLKNTSQLDASEHTRPVLEDMNLHAGLSIYAGSAGGKIDLLGAAEASLEKGRNLAGHDNLQIASYAVAAAPVVEAKLVLWNDGIG